MKKISYIVALVLFTALSAHAQRVLTLEECLDIALNNNLDIKRARNEAISARAGYTQSKFEFLPYISAGASHSWNEGLYLDQNTGNVFNTTTLGGGGSINASVTIFDGFQKNLALSRNELLLEASEQGIASSVQTTEASIVSAFLLVISSKESLKIAQQRLDLLNGQLDVEGKREKAGVGNMERVYNFQSQVAQQKLIIVQQENALASNQLRLVQLLLLDPSEEYEFEGISIDDVELETQVGDYNDIYNRTIEHSPSIKMARLNVQASEKTMKIAQNAWMPTLSANGRYGTNWSSNIRDANQAVLDVSTQFKNNVSKSASLSLSIPLFTNFRNRTQFQQSKIQVLNSELTLEQTKNNFTNQVQGAYLELVNAKNAYVAAKESMVSLDAAFEFTKSRYDNGTIDFLTYLTSLNGKNAGELQLIQAKYGILLRQLILDIYTGELNPQN